MKRKEGYKMWGVLLCLVMTATVILSGCSGSNSGSGGGTSAPAPSSPSGSGGGGSQQAPDPAPSTETEIPKITLMNYYHSNTPQEDDGEVVNAVEEFSNVDLEITWVPQNVYEEKLNVTLASGEMPEVIHVSNPFASNILTGIEAGMFWELDPYFDEFPNIATYDPIVMENSKIGGKMYFMPKPRPLVRNGLIVREDWLKKLNLQLPTTIDEFYNLLVAFKEQDPDGNGQDDTYGIMFYEGSVPGDIFAWFGAPNGWKVDADGKFIHQMETAEYMEGLRFVRKLYTEGLVNPDFPVVVRNEARKDLYNNKVGISIEALDAVVPYYYFQMEETGNFFDLTAGGPIEGKAYAGTGFTGAFMIPKPSVKTEDDLKKILRYFDTQRSPEATEKFSKLVTENETREAGAKFNIDDLKNTMVNEAALYPPGDSEMNQLLRQRMEEHAAAAVNNPANGLIAPTQVQKGEQLNTILDDAKIQFIVGEIDEAGFQAAVENWRKTGGTQVAQELAELYKQKQ